VQCPASLLGDVGVTTVGVLASFAARTTSNGFTANLNPGR
jgi:hypothetical protein